MWEFMAPLVLGGGVAVWNTFQNYRHRRYWRDAAVSCALQDIQVLDLWDFGVRGKQGRLDVRIEKAGQARARISIGVPGPADFHAVRIRPESRMQGAREIEIGDPFFDDTFSLQGPMPTLCALLDAETRRLLCRANAETRLEISNGWLRAELPHEEVPRILPLLLDICQRFMQSMEAAQQRLAENATRDPAAGVRLQNLLVLIREMPRPSATVEVLHTACSDRNPEVRLRAAQALGQESRHVLRQLAESIEDDAVSAEAVTILDRELPFERAMAILDLALRGRRIQTARACVEALGRSVDAAAQAPGTTGCAAAEPPLIQALQHESTEIQEAAAIALGKVGSVTAVPLLNEAAERSRLNGDLRRAVRQAIAEIQSRLPEASPGQLSLAGAEMGQLSLAEAEEGQLSLADDQAGQLSLPQE
jgi:hypothetical protein